MPLHYSSSDETHSSLTSNSNNTGEIIVPTCKASGTHKSVQTESTNRRVLDYSRLPRDKYGQISGESSSDEPVMAMPASTQTAMRNDSSSSASDHSTPLKVKFQPKIGYKFGSSQQSGPHCYQCCPRRTSLPPSTATICHHSPSPIGPRPDHTEHVSSGKLEPFKCGGHVDKYLLSRREFPKPTKHKTRLRKNGLQASTSPTTPRMSTNGKSTLSLSAPAKPSSRQDAAKPEPSLSELYGRYLNDDTTIQLSKNYKASPTPPFSPIPHAKYNQPRPPNDLKLQPGNKREGVDSPSHLIQQKVDRMLRDYCACRVS